LEHVYAAVLQGHPKEDWLPCDILGDLPVEPLSSRGKQKLKHRGKGKATTLNRAAFVSKQLPGLKRKDEQLLWLDYKKAK
jgi:hypothetical protein